MNLLIFVTAIFAIIAYFTFGLSDLMLSQRALYLAETYSNEVGSIINSPSNCSEMTYTVPLKIQYFGGKSLFYVLKISAVEGETDSVTGNKMYYIVFSIASRKNQNEIIASKSIATQTIPFIYKQAHEELPGLDSAPLSFGEAVIVDPQSKSRMDSFIVVKATKENQGYVYIANCSSGGPWGETCGVNKPELFSYTEGNCWK